LEALVEVILHDWKHWWKSFCTIGSTGGSHVAQLEALVEVMLHQHLHHILLFGLGLFSALKISSL
jgi:hypothetical protein